jgi:hypothetical protein
MRIVVVIFVLCLGLFVRAQDQGIISIGFQSETQWYRDDSKINATIPDEEFGSNNYLKIDYAISNFTMGIRYEAYFPPLLGYPPGFDGQGIANRYASFQNDMLQVTVGNFYEQFGSGIILRAYEERLLGIDNSIDGVHVKVSPIEGLYLTGLAGRQRDFFEVSDGTLRAFDGTFQLNDLFNWESSPRVQLAGSVVSKFEEYTGPDDAINEIVNSYSGRLDASFKKWNFGIEYVEKDKDPSRTNNFNTLRKGRALLTRIGYYKKGFGISSTFRRLENMDFRSEREASLTNLFINYLPSETRQHSYLLPNIYPYAAQLGGEIGGQVDVNYTAPKNSLVGGKYGTKINLNFSAYNGLSYDNASLPTDNFENSFLKASDTVLYRDFNIEVTKRLSKSFKTTLSYIHLEYNKRAIEGVPSDNVVSNIGVVELTKKFAGRKSLRIELQHLSTDEDKQNWMGSLAEFTMAPTWSFYAFDQYNYGEDEKIHFYQFGCAYSKNTSRIGLSYGRQRGGLICVGGVCRNVPASTGWSLSISTSLTQ